MTAQTAWGLQPRIAPVCTGAGAWSGSTRFRSSEGSGEGLGGFGAARFHPAYPIIAERVAGAPCVKLGRPDMVPRYLNRSFADLSQKLQPCLHLGGFRRSAYPTTKRGATRGAPFEFKLRNVSRKWQCKSIATKTVVVVAVRVVVVVVVVVSNRVVVVVVGV